MALFETHECDLVIHPASKTGMRYSIDNQRSYLESNITGTFEALEGSHAHPSRHMLLASISLAYGANTAMHYVEMAGADHQFWFFSFYGSWGCLNIALFEFIRGRMNGKPIGVYNYGDVQRDFTYIYGHIR